MKFKISNQSNLDFSKIKPFLDSFLPFAQNKMGFNRPPSISFVSDRDNGTKTLGKTAFYDPNLDSVVIYTDGRHPKDMLRSISHELVHHTQNCQGKFDKKPNVGEGYFQKDEYMQEMEREAYEKGNMTFRDWEETHKKQLEESIYYNTGETKMKLNEWKNEELFGRLLENFGYKAPKQEEITHLCAMLVTETATGKTGHPINHTLLEDGTVTHYDVEFDDVIMEGMPVEALTVEVQKEHMHSGRKEDAVHDEKKPREKYMEEEELDEMHCGGRREDEEVVEEYVGRLQEPVVEEGEDLEEAKQFAGDDDLDGDKDGKPKWADPDDPANKGDTSNKKDLDESLIREAVRKAIKKAFNK